MGDKLLEMDLRTLKMELIEREEDHILDNNNLAKFRLWKKLSVVPQSVLEERKN